MTWSENARRANIKVEKHCFMRLSGFRNSRCHPKMSPFPKKKKKKKKRGGGGGGTGGGGGVGGGVEGDGGGGRGGE